MRLSSVFGLVPRYLVQYHSIWSSTTVFGPVQWYLVHYHSIWSRTIVFGPEPQTGLLGCVRIRACVSDRARSVCREDKKHESTNEKREPEALDGSNSPGEVCERVRIPARVQKYGGIAGAYRGAAYNIQS